MLPCCSGLDDAIAKVCLPVCVCVWCVSLSPSSDISLLLVVGFETKSMARQADKYRYEAPVSAFGG